MLSDEILAENAEIIYNFEMTIQGIKEILWQLCKAQKKEAIEEVEGVEVENPYGEQSYEEISNWDGGLFNQAEDIVIATKAAIIRRLKEERDAE